MGVPHSARQSKVSPWACHTWRAGAGAILWGWPSPARFGLGLNPQVGLEQPQDIALDARYSALCGYTDADVDTVFAPELMGFDREIIRRWYNGYNWLGTAVYNPLDQLMFSILEFRPYWFETGMPSFLIKLLNQRQ